MHAEQLAIFGGPDGVRDQGILDLRLPAGQPIHLWANRFAALAAAYAFGLAPNHPFVDGNKRAAFHAMMVFLGRNEYFLGAPGSATAMILSLAAGEVSEESLTRWIRDNWPSE